MREKDVPRTDAVEAKPLGCGRRREAPVPSAPEPCMARGEAVGAFEIEDDWLDVGQHEQLKEARGDKV